VAAAFHAVGRPVHSSSIVTGAASSRLPSLDVAKGVAILFVIGIHAELLSPSPLYTHAINRAVPMFLVLFGITSTLWWDKQDEHGAGAAWYRSRLSRLLPAYWLAVIFWWSGQRVLSERFVGTDALAWSLAGYAPWIQTSWFVTAILQIVIVFPLLRWAYRRLGATSAVVSGFVMLAAVQAYALELNAWLRGFLPYYDRALGFYALWLFVPGYFWFVLCGMSFAHRVSAITLAWTMAALVIAAVAAIVASVGADASAISRVAMAAADPARTVILLAAATAVARITIASAPLAWLGRNSWEIYVGQMAIHSLAYPAWCRLGGPTEHRFGYVAVLLAGGVGFAFVYSELRRRLIAREARA